LFKTPEGVLHELLTNKNKNSREEEKKFGPPPMAPWGVIFIFFGKYSKEVS
jgi:hypothetical protein